MYYQSLLNPLELPTYSWLFTSYCKLDVLPRSIAYDKIRTVETIIYCPEN